MDYFDKQNIEFFDFLNQTFDISKSRRWDDIAKNVTILKVKRTYRVFAKLFPRNFNYLNELEKTKTDFSSIHYGTIKANKILDEVVRFSLYSDKIIVFHPLQNPVVTNQSIDPRLNPKYWLPDFLDSLYFYIVIQKWVKSGIVKLIINPYDYDLDLRDNIDKQIEARVKKSDFKKFYDMSKDSSMNDIAEQFAVTYKNRSKDYIIESLLEMKTPKFKLDDANLFADKIIEAIPRINPLYDKLNLNLGHSMLIATKCGGPLESIFLVSERTGANIYTPSEATWQQINEFGLDDFWLNLGYLYSKIPLNFLNNVDTSFALELRKQDRLSGVRQELKKIYSELGSIKSSDLTESRIRFIQEGFIEEIKKSEAEWKSIKKQADLARKYWIAGNIGIPFLTNDVSILPLALGSIAWLYMNEKSAKERMNLNRTKNSISVYVDLKNRKQSFFTEFRNCIM